MKAKIQNIDKHNPNGFGGMVSRAIPMAKENVDFEKGIDTIATTEAPAMVVDWERWQIVREILPMRYMESPNNDKVPLLDSHSRVSVEKIKGSASNFITKGAELLCKCFISKSESVVRQKIEEGHIDSVSIGYMTSKDETVEIPKKAEVLVDGVLYRNDYEDNVPLLVRTWWKAHELSLVPIGADQAAKFKSEGIDNKKYLDKIAELETRLAKVEPKEKQLTADEIELGLLIKKHN